MTAQPRRKSLRLQRKECFAYLPSELQGCIAERLLSGRDIANFRLTARLGRDAVPFAGFAPVLMLPFDPECPDGTATFYRPTDGETITMNLPVLRGKEVCGSSRGWLALVDEAASVTLLNPFTGATADLPPANKRVGEACSRRVSIDAGSRRCIIHSYFDPDVRRVVGLSEMREVLFREIVLSSQPDSGDCVAVALLARSMCVAVCRVGVDAEWKLLDAGLTCRVRSILHCCGSKFLAIGYNGEIAICDVGRSTPRVTKTQLQPLYPPRQLWARSYMQVDGKLHLVGTVYHNFTYHHRVYTCNVLGRKQPKWSRVKKVAGGDVTLFVSKNFMMGHGGASLPGLKKNSIYFSEPIEGRQADPNHNLEVNDIANGKSELVPYREKVCGSSEALCWVQPKPNPWTQGRHTKA